MKKIGFIADFFSDQILGGGESNDSNLIKYLSDFFEVNCINSTEVTKEFLQSKDFIIVGNFVMLSEENKSYLVRNKDYVIYEHDHKYVNTRDPSRFSDFLIPDVDLVNKDFYENSKYTVVLSSICEEVLNKNLPLVNTKNIGCSLWSERKFNLLEQLSQTSKVRGVCVMKSSNPTKNFHYTMQFCNKNEMTCHPISSNNSEQFLRTMSEYETFLFIPTVLETFSRVCAEAKMMNLNVMTNKKMIGFFSEDSSNLQGIELVTKMKDKNREALSFFRDCIWEKQ
tara:strand:- start:2240 stop:3085 length:846 start_codon:yes stop_codon:yes gene_type:complete